MSKQINKFLAKILILSTFLVLVFNIGVNLINANSDINKTSKNNNSTTLNNNSTTFKSVNNNSLGKVGVAITTNIGIQFKKRGEIPATIYKEVFSISEIINNQNTANKELIGKNMIAIEEYKNILKTNIKQLINNSFDKPRTLNAFIDQLEYRYTIGIINAKKLTEQKSIFNQNMIAINGKIEALKAKIEKDFKENNAEESLENINQYLELKKQYYYSRTYIIYINHFLSEYNYLNKYNKLLLDTLINNKDALIKNAYVVIPDSGSSLLKKFDLIYDENQIKSK